MGTPAAYEALAERVERLTHLRDATGVLAWDQQVMMPDGGAPARAQQQSALNGVHHDLLTDDEMDDLLEAAEAADLDGDQRAVVREMRRRHEEETRVPGDLVEEMTRTSAEAQQVWQDAKAEDDFESFAPTLAEIRDLHVERAGHLDPDRDPYRVMFEGVDPEIDLATVEDIFADLEDALVPLLEDLKAADADLATVPEVDRGLGDEPDADDLEMEQTVLDTLAYDRERGRFDTSPHPFTSGTQFDCRITTWEDPDDPMSSLTATIHEYGHASYQLGLPREHYGTPRGQAIGEIHESQSRFWENHVGRTRAFWDCFAPTFNDHLGTDLTPRECYEAANRIYPENLIRVEADELTYHLHIILRSDVEKRFVREEIEVAEVPQVWNDAIEDYLGVRPETDTKGCLQDIHWTGGFATFQFYTIGSVLAAQLDAAMRRDLDADVDELIRDGEFEPLLEWQRENVHRHGQRYRTDELVERATGEPLTAEYFIEYAEDKFRDLYGV